jgi:hypothetical protein
MEKVRSIEKMAGKSENKKGSGELGVRLGTLPGPGLYPGLPSSGKSWSCPPHPQWLLPAWRGSPPDRQRRRLSEHPCRLHPLRDSVGFLLAIAVGVPIAFSSLPGGWPKRPFTRFWSSPRRSPRSPLLLFCHLAGHDLPISDHSADLLFPIVIDTVAGLKSCPGDDPALPVHGHDPVSDVPQDPPSFALPFLLPG